MLKLDVYNSFKRCYLDDQEIKYISHSISEDYVYISVEGIKIISHYSDKLPLIMILEEYPNASYNSQDVKIKKMFWFFGKVTAILDGFFYTKGKRFIKESNNWQITYWED